MALNYDSIGMLSANAKSFSNFEDVFSASFDGSSDGQTSDRFLAHSDSFSSNFESDASFYSGLSMDESYTEEVNSFDKYHEIEQMLRSLELDSNDVEKLNSSKSRPSTTTNVAAERNTYRSLQSNNPWKPVTSREYPIGKKAMGGRAMNSNLNASVSNYSAAQLQAQYLAAMGYSMFNPSAYPLAQNGITFVPVPVPSPVGGTQPMYVMVPVSSKLPFATPVAAASASDSASCSLRSSVEDCSDDEVIGHVKKLFRDQVGCRLLQQRLKEGNEEIICAIYNESLECLSLMMTDPFGNYLFQKLFEHGNEEQCSAMLDQIRDDIVNAATNIHGTRSVQKVIEICKSPSQIATLQASLLPSIVDLCLNTNGNHVIQKAVQCLSCKDKNFIFEAVMANCKKIACHRHGCCVLQRCLDAASNDQQRVLISTVISHALELMQDPFGNYVVQYVLDLGRQTEAWAVAEKCIGNVALLSTQKFSSNVMEKCLEKANDNLLKSIVTELSNPSAIVELLLDQYANYVVQKAITVAPTDVAMKLIDVVRPHLATLKDNSGGKRIISKILKRFPKLHIGEDIPVC